MFHSKITRNKAPFKFKSKSQQQPQKYNKTKSTKVSDSQTQQTHYNQSAQQQFQNINSQQNYLKNPSKNMRQYQKNIQKITKQSKQKIYEPRMIIGRKGQKKQISEFINNCLLNQINNRCLYISGCPGVGKTSTVMQIVKKIQRQLNGKRVKFPYINALSLKRPSSIYKQFLLQSKGQLQSKSKQPSFLAVEFDQYLKRCRTNYFFIIDQIDFLYTKDQNVLYNIVEWCSQHSCKFSVIMIANTIDFPERLSAKIISRMGTQRMCFRPYSSTQIKAIIEQRLGKSKYFQQKVINFASKKFSSYSSDLRKVFRIIDLTIQNCQGQKVTIQNISVVWQKIVQEEDIEWKQELPQIYTQIIDMIKKDGGKSHTVTLGKYLTQKGINTHEINFLLNDLKQMGLLKMIEKRQQGCSGFSVILEQI